MTKTFKFISVLILAGICSMKMAHAQVTKDSLDQHADQAQGNYAATNLNYLGSGSLGMMQSAWKDPLQHMGEGQSRPGYSKYYWTPDLVLPVRLREGMYTLINFPSWEIVENVYLGDGTSFEAQIEGPSSLMVYPNASQFVGVDTNMIVFGRSGNKYVFYVQSETVNTDRITNSIIDIEVVKKNNSGAAVSRGSSGYVNQNGYSQDTISADSTYTRDLQREDWIEKIPVDPTKFRFDIEVYVPNPDDIIIAPERVWRDNIFTYIDLGEKALTAVQRPIVTLIVERSETPVGFRAAGPNNRLIIVEGMGDMVLRSGKRLVCLKLRRADSDGLENTIYAKTNEWDLQASYASQPDGTLQNTPDGIEDVYGTSENGSKSQVTPTNGESFFNSNSFTNGAEGSASTNKAGNVAQGIDSLPKVTPIVAQNSSNEPVLEGQSEIKAGNAEVVVPEYNNDKVNEADKKQADEILKAVQLGNSKNNSSPVLINSNSEKKTDRTVITAETEAILQEYRNGKAFDNNENTHISIELGTDENVNNLEKLWNSVSKKYSAALGKYQPFYSVDAPADGQGKDVFHLRIGPVKTLEEGDNICSQLGRNGIFCSVVRIQ